MKPLDHHFDGDAVVLVDTGQSPKDSHAVMAAVKKLTQQPVRFIIHIEPHPDHAKDDSYCRLQR